MYRCEIAQVGQFYIITKTTLVLFRELFYIVKAPNSSHQERRFRPYDADLAIKILFVWPYIGLNWPRNRGQFSLSMVRIGSRRADLAIPFWPIKRPKLPLIFPKLPLFFLKQPRYEVVSAIPYRAISALFTRARTALIQKGQTSSKIGLFYSPRWPYFRAWNRSFRFTA